MASNLISMASHLLAMASNLIAQLLAMASNLIDLRMRWSYVQDSAVNLCHCYRNHVQQFC